MGSPQESFAMFASKVVQLLLLPSALGLVRFPRVQVSQDLQISDEEDAKVLSNDPESDAYIDQILANLATTIIENGLDPATLPDADTGFGDTILGITFHGSAHLFNGHFWRLSTIHRTGDTSFTIEGTKVRLTANIGVDAPTAHIDVSGLGPLDWILELLVDFVDTFLKDWIVSLVEGPLKDLIQQLLDEYVPDFPPSAIV